MSYLLAGLFVLALAVGQAFYGGAMRPVFALPLYLGVGLCGILGLSALWRRNASAPALPCVISVLSFATWLLWRTGNSPDVWLASGYERLILACLVAYLFFAFVVTNPIHRLTLFFGLVVLASVQVTTEIWQFNHAHRSFALPWFSEQLRIWYSPRFGTRSHGFYLNANHLVWFTSVVGLFSLSAACWGRWGIAARLLTLYVALACFAGSVLTASRGGLLGLAGGLMVFALLSGLTILVGSHERRRAALAVLGGGLLAAIGTVYWVYSSSYIAQGRFTDLLGDPYRPSLLAVAARVWQLDPLLGRGAGMFGYYACKLRTMNDAADDIYAHNDWAQLLTDFGLPAALLLLAVILLHGTYAVRSLFSILKERMSISRLPQSHAASLLMAALACLAVFTVESFFDFNMQIPVNAVLAAGCLGLLANSGVTAGRGAPKTSFLLRFGGCALAALGGGWLIFLSVSASKVELAWLRAENAYIAGRPKETLAVARGVLSPEVVHPPFFRLAALASIESNRFSTSPWERLENTQNAIELYARARQASPLDWKNSFQLGTALKMAGRLREAEQSSLDTILLNPTQSPGFELYGDCLAEEGRLAEARGAYQRAVQIPGETHARKTLDAVEIKMRTTPPR